MPEELRTGFHRDLREIDGKVVQLFALVGEGLAAATDALLSGDVETAKTLMERDDLIDSLYLDVERLVQHQLVLQSPMAEHIARRATRGITGELTPRVRGLLGQMGRVGVAMWREAADAYVERDASAADVLTDADDEMDELHVSLTAELVSGNLTVPVALELALVGRFYERLGDHAVNIAKRVRYLAGGVG